MRPNPLRIVAVLALLGLCVCASAVAAKGGSAGLASRLGAVTKEVNVESHLVGDDVQQLEGFCNHARLNRHDAQKKAESDALLTDATKLFEDALARDFEPAVKGPHSDYGEIARAIQVAAAASAPGVRHHALVEASLKLRQAQVTRNDEISYVRREVAPMQPDRYTCQDFDLQQAAFGDQREAEGEEKEALQTLEYALRQKPSVLKATHPTAYKLHVELTVTDKATMSLAPPEFCGETGMAGGTATESVDFPAFEVNYQGVVKPDTTTATPTVAGTWTASGDYAPENQCDHLTRFSCNGGYEPILAGAPTATLAILAEKSSVARAEVELPEISESGLESCPDGSAFSAYIPLPLGIHGLAVHADTLDFPIDGQALRGRFEPLQIGDDGIEDLGPDLPAEDCIEEFSPSTGCTAAGSGVKVEARIEPVEG